MFGGVLKPVDRLFLVSIFCQLGSETPECSCQIVIKTVEVTRVCLIFLRRKVEICYSRRQVCCKFEVLCRSHNASRKASRRWVHVIFHEGDREILQSVLKCGILALPKKFTESRGRMCSLFERYVKGRMAFWISCHFSGIVRDFGSHPIWSKQSDAEKRHRGQNQGEAQIIQHGLVSSLY